MNTSYFSHIETALPDPILGVTEAFRADPSPDKVNLGVGIYQDGNGAIPLLGCVKEAAARWLGQEDTKAYLPIDGVASFNTATQYNLFGASSEALAEKRVATIQSVGGSGALKLGIEFIRLAFPNASVYVSDPSWENHRVLFEAAGAKVLTYPYYDPQTSGLRSEAMLEALRRLPSGSVVLLHACCHNPTGVDLGKEEWDQVADICSQRSLLPFVDIAYQGFAVGLDEDAYPIRLLVEKGLTFLVASSYAKSFALYRERAGALSIVTGSSKEAAAVTSQVKKLVRTLYSSPPSYGAQIVSTVLNDPTLRAQWVGELGAMRVRIQEMRKLFVEQLKVALPSRDFSFVLRQRGMFSYSGLSAEIVRELRAKNHIYALESGRICVAAMNTKNVEYICRSIAAAINNQ
jgi:aromatic-amino-acid transaminase